jgi:hypothetical protein
MPTTNDITTPLRGVTDRGEFVGRLRAIADARVDIVAALPRLNFTAGQDHAASAEQGRPVYTTGFRLGIDEPILRDSGVVPATRIVGGYTRTALMDVADTLRIPRQYVDRLHDVHPHLLGANINTLVDDEVDRKVFTRWLAIDDDEGGTDWTLRSVASNRYRAIDNLDLLVAVTKGMSQADLSLNDAEVEADWTMDRFRLRVAVPQLAIEAPELLAGYRWPFSFDPNADMHRRWQEGDGTPPVIWAGFEVTNSETGLGAATITPRIVVQVCRNGLLRKVDARRAVHAGERLDEGQIVWSDETRRLQVDMLTSTIADTVRTWCTTGYLRACEAEALTAKGDQVANVTTSLQLMRLDLSFTESETDAVLDAFVRGGDTSRLGLAQAVTAAARTVESGDRQADMEAAFWTIVNDDRFSTVTA